jgi:hypothetical protein
MSKSETRAGAPATFGRMQSLSVESLSVESLSVGGARRARIFGVRLRRVRVLGCTVRQQCVHRLEVGVKLEDHLTSGRKPRKGVPHARPGCRLERLWRGFSRFGRHRFWPRFRRPDVRLSSPWVSGRRPLLSEAAFSLARGLLRCTVDKDRLPKLEFGRPSPRDAVPAGTRVANLAGPVGSPGGAHVRHDY